MNARLSARRPTDVLVNANSLTTTPASRHSWARSLPCHGSITTSAWLYSPLRLDRVTDVRERGTGADREPRFSVAEFIQGQAVWAALRSEGTE
jgi:hypothetical protein